MTQRELDRAVAKATCENLRVITRLGFSLADPVFVEHDPEPSSFAALDDAVDPNDPLDLELKTIDWDEQDLRRNVPIFHHRSPEALPA
jgi:hypothetical protein